MQKTHQQNVHNVNQSAASGQNGIAVMPPAYQWEDPAQYSFDSNRPVLLRAAIDRSPVNEVPSIVHEVLHSPGQPLDDATRADMEPRFRHDFSGVRVHTDAKAAESARVVNALAYTVGRDVVFGMGQYAPQTSSGQRLMAHELTHVLQQQDSVHTPVRISHPSEAAEIEAAQSESLSHGVRPGIENSMSRTIMRQADGEERTEQEEEGPGFWATLGGGLIGEFNEDPNFAMIGVDLGVSLIPVLDQVSDARDIIAHLYYMIFRNQYARFMRWVGLVFSLIGLIPEVGSAIKGASKFIIRGVREVIDHLLDLLRPIRRLLPEIADIGRFQSYIARNWSRFMSLGTAFWNRALDRVSGWISVARRFTGGLTQRIQDLVTRIRRMAPDMLRRAFDWVKQKIDSVLNEVAERLGLRSRRAESELNERVERAFAEHPNAVPSQPYQTTSRLARGNLGERLATDALAADGHHILSFKPSILGTNQGGIDIVTIRNGVVHLIDNKALTRSGNVSSVSALTTNFAQNLATVRRELTTMLSDAARSTGERQLIQQALNALNSGNFVRVVTNANLTPDSRILSGVTQQLQSQGITFMNVFP